MTHAEGFYVYTYGGQAAWKINCGDQHKGCRVSPKTARGTEEHCFDRLILFTGRCAVTSGSADHWAHWNRQGTQAPRSVRTQSSWNHIFHGHEDLVITKGKIVSENRRVLYFFLFYTEPYECPVVSKVFLSKSWGLRRLVYCKEVCNMPFNDKKKKNLLVNPIVTQDKKDGINGVK